MTEVEVRDEERRTFPWRLLLVLLLVAAITLAVWRVADTRTKPTQVPVTETEPTPEPEPIDEPAEEGEEKALPEQGNEPQAQERHPNLYVETGVSGTKTWNLEANSQEVIIVGGVTVDDTSGGVYRAIDGPTEVELIVTNGFALVINDEWAAQEFCFRVDQARQFDWAHAHVEPLSEWETCD